MRANRGPKQRGISGVEGSERDSRPVPLPLNTSFFCCVDFRDFRYVAEQIAFDVVEKERLGVRVREVQTVVIDDLCLFLQPLTPATLANLGPDALAEFVRERCEGESRTLLAAMCAFDVVRHFLNLLLRCSNSCNSSIIFRLE